MAEYLYNRQGNVLISIKNRENADYQCFFTWKKGKVLTFVANYKVKLTNTYKEVKKNSLLWNRLLKQVCKDSFS